MIYILSDLHGADTAYFEIKERIKFSDKDEMYILGDIFDGNNKNPQGCLNILEDIIQHNNIHLLLGNHEFAYIQRYLCQLDNDTAGIKFWEDFLFEPICGGAALVNYFNSMDKKFYKRYMEYLLHHCEIYALRKFRNTYIFMVHGSPIFPEKEDVDTQYGLLATIAGFDKKINYQRVISILRKFETELSLEEVNEITTDNLLIITGHTPTKYHLRDNPKLIKKAIPIKTEKQMQPALFYNQMLCIDCGCRANTLGKKNPDGWCSNLSYVSIDDNNKLRIHYYIQE